jgi:hypothetical protein
MLQQGMMMDRPLLISELIEHGATEFGHVEVVSRETHGPLHRYTYADCAARSRRLAAALCSAGLGMGAAVGPWPGTIIAISRPISACRAAG